MFEILCRFCGMKTGEMEIPYRLRGTVVTNESFGIVDNRCSTCEVSNGNYKEMAQEFEEKRLGDSDDFKQVIEEAEYKKSKFDDIIKDS